MNPPHGTPTKMGEASIFLPHVRETIEMRAGSSDDAFISTGGGNTIRNRRGINPCDGHVRTRREFLMNHNPRGFSTEPTEEAVRR